MGNGHIYDALLEQLRERDPPNFSFTIIPEGCTKCIPLMQQMIVANISTIEGEILIHGELVTI